MAKRKLEVKKTGLYRIPGYVRPMIPKEKVSVDHHACRVADDELLELVDMFDEEERIKHDRWKAEVETSAVERRKRRLL